jgi:hypothetical protein
VTATPTVGSSMKTYSKLLLAFFLLILIVPPVVADEPPGFGSENLPEGIFVDSLVSNAIEKIVNGSDAEQRSEIESVEASPDTCPPPVLYVLSNVLFQRDKKDEAAFWFYAAQLRARFDANRCADKSARQAVTILNNEYGQQINEYMFKNTTQLESVVLKVVEWDRKTAHNYDHRWINLHGMDMVLERLGDKEGVTGDLSLPEDQWDDIAERTRRQYLSGFYKVKNRFGVGHAQNVFEDPRIALLIEAAEKGMSDEIDRLVSDGVDVNAVSTEGMTLLEWMIQVRNKRVFQHLLVLGANPNMQASDDGSSPISLAAEIEDDSDWLKLVLQHDGNPNLVNPTDDLLSGKTTPIFNAIRSRRKENLELLIQAGAKLNHQDSDGYTPILFAAGMNWYDSVFYLLKAGADFRIKDKHGFDLGYRVVHSTVDPAHELGSWREKVHRFLIEK